MDNGSILIIDDESSLRKVLSDLLKMRGYHADAVASGPEAMERIRIQQYDVAIVDLRLGEEQMSGLEVIRSLKQSSPVTECIVLTANPTPQSAEEANRLGASSYIEKPFKYEQLLGTIREAIEKRPGGTKRPSPAARTAPPPVQPQAEGLEEQIHAGCLTSLEQIAATARQIRECSELEKAQAMALEILAAAQAALEAGNAALDAAEQG